MIVCSVSADSEFSCKFTVRSDSGSVIVSGTLPELYSNSYTVIQVINPNRQLQELDNSSVAMKDVINYQEETISDGNGKFEFDYKMQGVSGEYTVNIGVKGKDKPFTTSFYYYGPTYVSDVLNNINQAKSSKDSQKIKSFITQNYDKLSMDCSLYKSFIAKGKHIDEFYAAMTENKTVSSLIDLEKQIDRTIIVLEVNLAIPSDFNLLFTTYYNFMELDKVTAYKTYSGLDSTQKEIVCGKLVKEGGFTELSDFIDYFTKQTILTALDLYDGWGNIKAVLDTNSDVLMLDYTKYKMLIKPEEVYRLMEGKVYTTLEHIKEDFDKYVSVRYLAENPVKKDGGGGGGGSSWTVNPEPVSNIDPIKTETFIDLEGYDWAKESIESLYSKGIINGKKDKHFVPEDKITREEFVKLLVLGTGIPNDNDNINFEDVIKSEWYYPYIVTALKNGIITGKDENIFGIGEFITREDMATIAYRAIVSKKPNVSPNKSEVTFSDSEEISDYATEGVAFMQKEKIILGTGDGAFSPKNFSTRAQAATIVYRLIEFLNNNQ